MAKPTVCPLFFAKRRWIDSQSSCASLSAFLRFGQEITGDQSRGFQRAVMNRSSLTIGGAAVLLDIGGATTDLHYTIEARKLNAQHKVRIDQLEWGEATATKGEATLPVKFATSLLKDADGVISLDIPVTGTLGEAREEMKNLKSDNEKLLKEAQEERSVILRDARKIKDTIIEEAKEKANEEANNIVENAKIRIQNEKMAAMTDLKNQIAALSIDIAERILEHELSAGSKQEDYLKKLIKNTKLN